MLPFHRETKAPYLAAQHRTRQSPTKPRYCSTAALDVWSAWSYAHPPSHAHPLSHTYTHCSTCPQAADRQFRGLETETDWEAPFMFAQLADTQLGMINANEKWDEEVHRCKKAVEVGTARIPFMTPRDGGCWGGGRFAAPCGFFRNAVDLRRRAIWVSHAEESFLHIPLCVGWVGLSWAEQ